MTGNTKEIIRKYNIRLTKSLGQNFLADDTVISRIVDAAGITKADPVLEIGPGIGNMTRELAGRAAWVTAVEIDKHLIPALTDNLREFPNVTVLNEDIMRTDLRKVVADLSEAANSAPGSVKVAANLPYYITTPIVMMFLENNPGVDSMVFMVQKEVADRMTAKPGGKDYGALSVAVQYYTKPEKVFLVPPHSFIPQPEVDSVVIRLQMLKEPPVTLSSKELFFRVVKAAFGQRRKTLVNALSNSGYFMETKEGIVNILKNIGISENQRGETLSIMQFAELANSFFEKKH